MTSTSAPKLRWGMLIVDGVTAVGFTSFAIGIWFGWQPPHSTISIACALAAVRYCEKCAGYIARAGLAPIKLRETAG